MTLPVSSYEELLNRVRSLTHETRQLQRQIDAPLLDHNENERLMNSTFATEWSFKPRADGFTLDPPITTSTPQQNRDVVGARWTKEQGASPEAKEQEESPSSQGTERGMKLIGQGPMCHSTTAANTKQAMCDGGLSYSYSYSSEQLGTKVEMVYNLLSMLGTHDRAEMTSTLLAMSSSPDSCKAMRQSGCLSLLVQLVHSSGESVVVRQRAAQALRNMILCHSDDKRGRREARVLRLLDQVSNYCDALAAGGVENHVEETHPGPSIAALMKLSFDEEHRLAMCQLGALYVVARLVQVEAPFQSECCITLKRYAGMALTNLTFGDGNNKALLCSMKPFMTALVAQLSSSSEDLTQVTASVLRNLSWRADAASKQSLREVGSVPALVKAAMTASREPTLKSVLSALWNLSAHCNINKVDICGVDGALQYLVQMLNYQPTSKTLAVVENAGGILRNISSHIAVREDYRKILRDQNCLAILLRQLQSASLTVVSNACGTLWNLSARCATDQRALVALGAVPMLTSLAHSRHRMIAMGASAALKNLLPIRLAQQQASTPSGSASLLVRKRRALEAELNSSLSETCDNIDPCPQWDSDKESTTSQAKDDCDQINHSVQQITLDEAMTEQPVNYSLKYCENENKGTEADNDTVNYSIKFSEPEDSEEKKFSGSCFKEEAGPQSDYAETDLDQLTDYSLRYSEEEQNDTSDTRNAIATKNEDSKPPADTNLVETSPEKRDQGKNTVLETPLMFSRCSSLGSLSSCEQQDDCRSSVVSEFSRMTSGIMSPSDLPDSPTQTVPPSPRVKAPPSLPVTVEESKPDELPGVFDDSVVAFKEESTPAQFSTATSLSDLTFDDEQQETVCEKLLAAVSEEEDENILADCISSGMQNNRESNLSRIPRVRGIPVKAPANVRPSNQALDETPVQFCTEDTPASLSHATSHSELSCALSDASSDHENILAECIQSGMPQPQALNSSTDKKPSKIQIAQVSPKIKTAAVKPRPASIPTSRMRQLVAEDEVNVFATEGSPGNFSIRSSLSDLTINSRPEKLETTSPHPENSSPLSSLDPEVASADDVTLAEQEDQALLMQVISSGLPTPHAGSGGSVTVNSDSVPKDTDTWADDTSSFPSISLTIPAVQSYNSDDDEKTEKDDATLTDSRIIKLDSGKVALISHLDMEGSYQTLDQVQPPSNMASILSLSGSASVNDRESFKKEFELHGSLQSLQELEMVQPPSGMNSIISLSSSLDTDHKKSARVPLTRADSLLENVKPPTEMDDIPDLDNSIMSVASLTSEIAESLEDLTLEATPPSQRKATAKQRRELGKFRYNTYVVSKNTDKKLPSPQIQTEVAKSTESLDKETSPKTSKITPKQRRQADRERFRTRTIHDGPPPIDRLSSVESECQISEGSISPLEPPSESTSEADEPPRPIVVKPPEVKSIRGGSASGRGSSIPVVRSPVKTTPPTGKKKPIGTAAPLQRQGTFTKDEPSSSIPVPIKSKIASPLKKNPLVASKSVGNCSGGRGRAASLPNKSGLGVRTSLSNQSLKSVCSEQNGSTRWHSNTSLNGSPTPPLSSHGNPAREPRKDTASKIASLWKKVDESKKKQTNKDTRVWIPPEPKSKQVA